MSKCAFCDTNAASEAYMAIEANDGRQYGGSLNVCHEHQIVIALEAGKVHE